MKLQETDIYLTTLSREDCKTLWNDFEYDFDNPTEELNLGHSDEKAEGWFDEIQKLQGNRHIRLGIFKNDGTVIGDVALQDIDRVNRNCSVGMGMAKIENRSKGYGTQAVMLMLNYGFRYLGLERITANTLDLNIGAQKLLDKCGFVLEGRERKSVYLNSEMHDKLNYAILKEEFLAMGYEYSRT
ncbi:MAG: GNAT family N-acetyltransferase [Lachnospiraceae bacterium]|nr:GNAT family N-acetyltransferase [Lachnospiraceae bacterium]